MLTPYILFDGTCEEAMRFYQERLGGALTMAKVSESVLKDHMPANLQDKVLNARLKGPSFDISASDWMRPDQEVIRGNSVCLYFSGGSRADLENAFERLSDGAEVTDPLRPMPVGLYGALNDRFGIRWMFHAE